MTSLLCLIFSALGIFVFWYNDHILVEGCTVSFNIAARSVGGMRFMAWSVTILNSTIVGNVAMHDYGGIYIDDGHAVVIRNTDLSNNTARGDVDARFADVDSVGCGSVGLYNCEDVVVDNCTLNFNEAYLFGGAMCVIYSIQVVIQNTAMGGNIATTGGALNVYNSQNVFIDGLHIGGNSARGDGGGLSVSESNDLHVNNCSFLGNIAKSGSGSACYVSSSSVLVEGNMFDSNEALLG